MNEIQPHIPFVSIIVPTLNSASDIEGCINSLKNQNYPKKYFEIIIVDNGSTDGTMDILPLTGVRCFMRKERGRSKALNTGIENAKGEIICTTDISCRAEPDWISTVVKCFADASNGCVAGEIKLLKTFSNPVLDFQERSNYMSPMLALERTQIPYMPFADGANASFRKQLFDEIGYFEESFIKGADVEICYRMFILTKYKLAFSKDAVVWEPGEPTLRALLKQRFRMGIGKNLLAMKYPALYRKGQTPSGVRKVYWSLHHLLKRLRSLFLANINVSQSRNQKSVSDMNIRFLMNVVQKLGNTWGFYYLRYNDIHPKPVEMIMVDDFLANSEKVSERIVEYSACRDQAPEGGLLLD